MQPVRPAFATHPCCFGRGQVRDLAAATREPSALGADFRLFASTFLVGFVFVSVLIA